MPCELCRRKCGFPITCNYCGGHFCEKCKHLEKHDCVGLKDKIRSDLISLEKRIEYKPDNASLSKGIPRI